MGKQDSNARMPTWAYAIIGILLIAIVILLFSNSQSKSQLPITTINSANSGSNQNYTLLQSNYSMEIAKYNSLENNYTALTNKYNSNTSNTSQEVVEVLYRNKTVSLAAPTYNPYYNYVIGCYWVDGNYTISFNAPYSGYIVFNQTNTGIPSNYSVGYFSAYVSTEKPFYYKPQPYNDSSYCPGEIVVSNIEPWTQITPQNNQTMIIPVRNGTNYLILYNGNANQYHGINPFPINVTFSLKYYGFKGVGFPSEPSFNINKTVVIDWSKYN